MTTQSNLKHNSSFSLYHIVFLGRWGDAYISTSWALQIVLYTAVSNVKNELWNSTLKLVFLCNTYIKSLENIQNTWILTKYITFKLCFYMHLKYHNAQTWSALIKCKITTSSSNPCILQHRHSSIKWLFVICLLKNTHPWAVDSSTAF